MTYSPDQVQVLSNMLDRIEMIENHQSGVFYDLALPGSELAIDDAALGYLQLSHLIGHCLAVSLDALRSVRLIMRSISDANTLRLPMMGHYSLLRSSLESAALATWLLLPNDHSSRVERAIQARMSEIHHDDQMVSVATEPLVDDDKSTISKYSRERRANTITVRAKKAHLRELAVKNDITEEAVSRGMPGFGPIVGAAAAAIGERSNETRSIWHLISGLAHPSVSRSTGFSNVEFVGGNESNKAFVTSDPNYTILAMGTSYRFHIAALELVSLRGGNEKMAFPRL